MICSNWWPRDPELHHYLHERLSRLMSLKDYPYGVEGYLKDTPDRVELFRSRIQALLENLAQRSQSNTGRVRSC